MKRIYLFAILLAFAVLSGSAQISKLFDRYEAADGVTSVYISKMMLSMIPDMEADGIDIKGLTGKIDSIRILTSEDAATAAKLKKELKDTFDAKGYETLVKVSEGDEKTNICMKSGPDGVTEYLIINEEKAEFTAILITGKLTPADVRNMVHVD